MLEKYSVRIHLHNLIVCRLQVNGLFSELLFHLTLISKHYHTISSQYISTLKQGNRSEYILHEPSQQVQGSWAYTGFCVHSSKFIKNNVCEKGSNRFDKIFCLCLFCLYYLVIKQCQCPYLKHKRNLYISGIYVRVRPSVSMSQSFYSESIGITYVGVSCKPKNMCTYKRMGFFIQIF